MAKKANRTGVTAAGGERSLTSDDVRAKASRLVAIPVRDIDDLENICCGFRAAAISAVIKGETLGGVDTGGGLGSPWIIVTWKGKSIAIHAAELLRAHVAEVAPKDLALFDAEG